jgi:hypothetical protein
LRRIQRFRIPHMPLQQGDHAAAAEARAVPNLRPPGAYSSRIAALDVEVLMKRAVTLSQRLH